MAAAGLDDRRFVADSYSRRVTISPHQLRAAHAISIHTNPASQMPHDALDGASDITHDFVLPHTDHGPSCATEPAKVPRVASPVPLDLSLPEF